VARSNQSGVAFHAVFPILSLLTVCLDLALIKTEGLDEVSRTRITREAQAMGRLGSHPHIVTVFDLGDQEGQPYMVTELMGGGEEPSTTLPESQTS